MAVGRGLDLDALELDGEARKVADGLLAGVSAEELVFSLPGMTAQRLAGIRIAVAERIRKSAPPSPEWLEAFITISPKDAGMVGRDWFATFCRGRAWVGKVNAIPNPPRGMFEYATRIDGDGELHSGYCPVMGDVSLRKCLSCQARNVCVPSDGDSQK